MSEVTEQTLVPFYQHQAQQRCFRVLDDNRLFVSRGLQELTQQQINGLVTYARENPHITILEIQNPLIHKPFSTDQESTRLAYLVSKLEGVQTLTDFRFSGVGLRVEDAPQIQLLLRQHPNIIRLDLCGNVWLVREMLTELANSMNACPHLASVNLANCGLRDQHAVAIRQILQLTPALSHLYLQLNRIHEDGALAIYGAIENLHTVQMVDLDYVPLDGGPERVISRRMEEAIKGILKKNGGNPAPVLKAASCCVLL